MTENQNEVLLYLTDTTAVMHFWTILTRPELIFVVLKWILWFQLVLVSFFSLFLLKIKVQAEKGWLPGVLKLF